MRVLLVTVFAVIGICLAQANAVPTAQYNKDEPSVALVADSFPRSVASTEDFFGKVIDIVIDLLGKAFQIFIELYKSVRGAIIAEINLWLKYLNINFDFGEWLDNFEKALVDCGRARKQEIIEDAKLFFDDVLTCIRTNIEQLEEMRIRGLLALEILQKSGPYFHAQYQDCKKSNENPSEPAQPGTSLVRVPTAAKAFETLTCLSKAVQETAVFLKPVPGHLYAFVKLLYNISFNDKKEVVQCFAKKSVEHFKFLQETAKSMAICVAFSA